VAGFAESDLEQATLAWLEDLGYAVLAGPAIAPGEPGAERTDYADVVLEARLRSALERLNPDLPAEAIDEAYRKLTRPALATLIATNHAVHRLLVEGVTVEHRRPDGSIAGVPVRVLDFEDPEANDWLAVNQLTVVEAKHQRRADVVLFVNGLPLAVIELKSPADEGVTLQSAYQQLETYKQEIPSLFACNGALVISDGVQARIGTLSASPERFMPWRTIRGEQVADPALPELQVVLQGVFERRRFLDLIRHFIVFEDQGPAGLAKKMAGHHQYHAVNVALEETLRACGAPGAKLEGGTFWSERRPEGVPGDRRVGVMWHTQGSGKSLTMAFYAGRVILHPAMGNPTLVVLTDRNDLDDQLFGTFSRCQELLRQPPVQAESRADLRAKLQVEAGGVIFTTIQKFFPEAPAEPYPVLSARRNLVVIAAEAQRSEYDFIDGFARHLRDALPNASFIGFTGTPIEATDRNTRAVFGDYISVYDIQRAVEDGATVPIYYESRLARLALDEAEKRLALIAEDLIAHWERRLEAMDGKAMVVCMSRRIAVDLYRALTKLRPAWHHPDDERGALKVVMTGSASDPLDWQGHIRNKARREALAKRFRDPADPFRMVIVRDMWLTGFDAPRLHTLYVDKPMRGHGLMLAIARVNRVFRDKPGGLVVDDLGLADELKAALATYSESGGQGRTAIYGALGANDSAVGVGPLPAPVPHAPLWGAPPTGDARGGPDTIAGQPEMVARPRGPLPPARPLGFAPRRLHGNGPGRCRHRCGRSAHPERGVPLVPATAEGGQCHGLRGTQDRHPWHRRLRAPVGDHGAEVSGLVLARWPCVRGRSGQRLPREPAGLGTPGGSVSPWATGSDHTRGGGHPAGTR
jgi:type I restriction enzyme R subunit